jgi:hypothetical protein
MKIFGNRFGFVFRAPGLRGDALYDSAAARSGIIRIVPRRRCTGGEFNLIEFVWTENDKDAGVWVLSRACPASPEAIPDRYFPGMGAFGRMTN